MKRLWIACLGVCLSGCALLQKHQVLPPLQAMDRIRVSYNTHRPVAELEIRDRAKLAEFAVFVNALPPRWTVPWYGPPVGTLYFQCYEGDRYVGNFYIGPNFFGRDTNEFWSQLANKRQMDRLSSIVGMDVWTFVHVGVSK